MPYASIVIPCFNAEAHIERTLESAQRQTVSDIEIICVDNNSTDRTAVLLRERASADPRISILQEPRPGEGPARDAGRRAARGSWLYFLDSDDLMDPRLLERACKRGEETRADVVIFKTSYLDDQTDERRACPECFETDWIHTWKDEGVFDPRENPERIFTSFQNWVHNKVFRASFLDGQEIYFQHVHRMADVLFTCRALSEAKRIALLDEELHLYRVNNPASALMTSDAYPLDFYEAFSALRERLESTGTWERYHDSFVNWAEEAIAMNVYRAGDLQSFQTIVTAMRQEGIERLDVLSLPPEKILWPVRHQCCETIAKGTLEEVLFLYLALERRHLSDVETRDSRLRTTRTYKLSRRLACLADALRRLARRP